MISNPTFSCSACGAPNKPEAGTSRMACTYCGTNLTIPENLQTAARPRVEKISSKAKPVIRLEKEAPDLLRKAEPIARKAWNLYAGWTWLRWLLPTCLTLFVIGCIACVALGALPSVLGLFR